VGIAKAFVLKIRSRCKTRWQR